MTQTQAKVLSLLTDTPHVWSDVISETEHWWKRFLITHWLSYNISLIYKTVMKTINVSGKNVLSCRTDKHAARDPQTEDKNIKIWIMKETEFPPKRCRQCRKNRANWRQCKSDNSRHHIYIVLKWFKQLDFIWNDWKGVIRSIDNILLCQSLNCFWTLSFLIPTLYFVITFRYHATLVLPRETISFPPERN